MAVKRTGQMSFVEAFIGGKIGGSSSVLDRIAGLVKWYRFEKLLAGFNHGGAGHPAWPALVLFKDAQGRWGLLDREWGPAIIHLAPVMLAWLLRLLAGRGITMRKKFA